MGFNNKNATKRNGVAFTFKNNAWGSGKWNSLQTNLRANDMSSFNKKCFTNTVQQFLISANTLKKGEGKKTTKTSSLVEIQGQQVQNHRFEFRKKRFY